MSFHKNCSTWSLIYSTALHTNNSVLNDINDSDTMLSADCIKLTNDISNLHFLTIKSNRHTLFKVNCKLYIFIRCFLRSYSKNKHMIVIRSLCRILKFESFVADMPYISVTAVGLIISKRKINTMSLTIIYLGFT